MNGLILGMVLVGGMSAPADGTLVYLQKSNGVVEFYTGSDKTHVGIVFRGARCCWVYEAAPGKVRRVEWNQYLRSIAEMNRRRRENIRVYIQTPTHEYSPADVYAMRHHLDMQLGRPYTIRHFLGDDDLQGVHCAELVGEGLKRSERFSLPHPRRYSPAQLLRAVSAHYEKPVVVPVGRVSSERPWCQRTWAAWTEFGAWCRWSCSESWKLVR